MEVSNLILAMDALASSLNAANRINAAIATALAEGRDITDEELRTAAAQTDALVDRVNQEL